LWREAAALAQRGVSETDPLWQRPRLDAAGMPVLLVGGLYSTPALLGPLADVLRRCKCQCVIAPVRFGIGCGEATTSLVEESLQRLVETSGQPAVVIGHSRGGQFGRAVAGRRPELVRGLITLGSPLTGCWRCAHCHGPRSACSAWPVASGSVACSARAACGAAAAPNARPTSTARSPPRCGF
jgi:pimeloyl-ACP methyl ester carboxylesterase